MVGRLSGCSRVQYGKMYGKIREELLMWYDERVNLPDERAVRTVVD